MSKLIINENPLLVLPSLAIAIGLNEAIILQQIHYWLDTRINNNIINGSPWVYNTYSQWAKQFPFWSEITIKRTIRSLEDKKLLISDNFNKDSFSKQKWYTINYNKLSELENSLKILSSPNNTSKQIESKQTKFDNSQYSSSYSKRSARSDQFDPINISKRSDADIKLIRSYIDTEITTETTNNSLSGTINKKSALQPFEEMEERECRLISIWNSIVEKKLGRETKLTAKRITLLKRILNSFFNNDILLWEDFCTHVTKSKFLMGEITDFRIQLDWILREDNLIKVIEGSYHREGKNAEFSEKNLDNDEDRLIVQIQKANTPEFWKKIMIGLLKRIGYSTFNAWLSKNVFIRFENGLLEIQAPSRFSADWQTNNFLNDIMEESRKAIPEIKECIIKY